MIPHLFPLLPVELQMWAKLRFCQTFLFLRGATNERPQRTKLKRENKLTPFPTSYPWDLACD